MPLWSAEPIRMHLGALRASSPFTRWPNLARGAFMVDSSVAVCHPAQAVFQQPEMNVMPCTSSKRLNKDHLQPRAKGLRGEPARAIRSSPL